MFEAENLIGLVFKIGRLARTISPIKSRCAEILASALCRRTLDCESCRRRMPDQQKLTTARPITKLPTPCRLWIRSRSDQTSTLLRDILPRRHPQFGAGSMAIDTGRRQFIFALGGTAAAWPFAARAEPSSYPERPLTMVVTFSAGGSSDVLARAVADAMSHGLGRQVLLAGCALRLSHPGRRHGVARSRLMRADTVTE
jgi:hypothetical protein